MVDSSTDSDIENRRNPYAAPAVDFSDPWSDAPADALALRRAHRREESLVKGLAITNFVYALFFGAGAVYEFSALIGHLTGRLNAAWRLRPVWIAMLVVEVCIPAAALSAGWGFLKRKRWAFRCELAVVVSWAMMAALEPLLTSTPSRPALRFLGQAAAHLALAAPLLSAWYLRGSVVFGAEYSEAIAATRRIWIWPRIRAGIILPAIAFFVVAIVLIRLSQRK